MQSPTLKIQQQAPTLDFDRDQPARGRWLADLERQYAQCRVAQALAHFARA